MRVALDRAGQAGGGDVDSAGLPRERSQRIESLVIGRLDREDLAVDFLGRGEVASFVMPEPGFQLGAKVCHGRTMPKLPGRTKRRISEFYWFLCVQSVSLNPR